MDTDQKMKILKERARQFAGVKEEQLIGGETLSGLNILLSEETYILDSRYVVEVLPLTEFTSLPCTPSFVQGIINVRGRILSLINMKKILNLPEQGITNLNRVVVVKHEDIELGLLADDVSGYNTVITNNLQKELPTFSPAQKEFVTGITPNGEIVFNLKSFLTSSKIVINEEV